MKQLDKIFGTILLLQFVTAGIVLCFQMYMYTIVISIDISQFE